MAPLFTLLALGSFAGHIAALPLTSPFTVAGAIDTSGPTSLLHLKRTVDTYRMFVGTGSTSSGWPSTGAWVSNFELMFDNNKPLISQSCAQWNVPNNSEQETIDLRNAIKEVSAETGVDARFILAIVMQESKGCVRAPTSNYGVRNPGLMQDHDGSATCNENGVQTPCPSATIKQMITDGTAGTAQGDGLVQLLARAGTADDSRYYKAARMYNSGSIASDGDLGGGIATHCYASDIANILTGWVHAAHACCLDSGCEPGDLTQSGPLTPGGGMQDGSPTGGGNNGDPQLGGGNNGNPQLGGENTSDPQLGGENISDPQLGGGNNGNSQLGGENISDPQLGGGNNSDGSLTGDPREGSVSADPREGSVSADPREGSISAFESAVAKAPLGGSNDVAAALDNIKPVSPGALGNAQASGPVAPGVTAACAQYYTVQPGDGCDVLQQKFGVSLAQLQGWNAELDGACGNLWLGYSYCVAGA